MEARWLHGAACHGCALVAETSCEMRNDYLGRARRAGARRVEVGLLVRDRTLAASVATHFATLIDRSLLRLLPA